MAEQNQTQAEPEKLDVDRNTFITMSLLQFDQDIAFAELKVAELKHKKSEFLLNQNIELIKQQVQAAKTQTQEQPPVGEPEVKK